MKPFAINVARNLYSISFENTEIIEIESSALKKNQMTEFRMTNTTIRSILPTRSFHDLMVTGTVTITNCSFTTINTNAFTFRGNVDFNIFTDIFV